MFDANPETVLVSSGLHMSSGESSHVAAVDTKMMINTFWRLSKMLYGVVTKGIPDTLGRSSLAAISSTSMKYPGNKTFVDRVHPCWRNNEIPSFFINLSTRSLFAVAFGTKPELSPTFPELSISTPASMFEKIRFVLGEYGRNYEVLHANLST